MTRRTRSDPDLPLIHTWLAGPLPKEVAAALARLRRLPDVRHVAVMPDVHLSCSFGHDVCVGTALATSRLLYPAAVGGDIGCGMAAIAFDAQGDLLHDAQNARRLLDKLPKAVPVHRRPSPHSAFDILHSAFPPLSHPALESIRRRDAAVQFATLGRGNHFLEFQESQGPSDGGQLWLMLHTGSRALGQAIRDHHLTQAQTSKPLAALDVATPAGQAYLSDLSFALGYADASRRTIVDCVGALIDDLFHVGAIPHTYFSCHHNHVRLEIHSGRALYVHRKGAIPAAADQPGIIPGSMNSPSFHTLGRGNPLSLNSSSHGAGRRLSRDQARRTISPHRLRHELSGLCYNERLLPALRDEAPSAYKDITAVLRAQRDLTRTTRRLVPLVSYKGTG